MAAKLAAAGGPAYTVERRRYELYGGVADYMVTRKAAVFQQFTDLRTSLLADILAAPSDKSAQKFVPLFWEVSGWREALDAHLITIKARGHTPAPQRLRDNTPDPEGRLNRLLGKDDDFGACRKKYDDREKPNYPVSAMYEGFTGAVILRVDLDAEGKASNPEILAAVPDKYFGDAVLKNVKNMRYLPGDVWDPANCSLAQEGHIIVFKFLIRRR
jgi:TonB family protein